MNISKQQKSGLAILILAAVSSVSLFDSTARYVGFFNALNELKLEQGKLSFLATPLELNLTIELTIKNPTNYGDLQLNGVTGTVYYEGENHTVMISPGGPRAGTPYQTIETNLWELPESYVSLDQPLQVLPFSANVFSMNVIAMGETAENFYRYYERTAKQQNIQWQLSLRVSITTPTFLKTMELRYYLDR